MKLLFEVEDLRNASPATVSRAGIIYVSDTDLDWEPVFEGWLKTRPQNHAAVLRGLITKYLGNQKMTNGGLLFDFINKN